MGDSVSEKITPEELIGQTIGEWEILEHLGYGKMKCRCSCGVVKVIQKYDLVSFKSTSCGHDTTAIKDLTGCKFGEWTVLHRENGRWLCRCSCGTERLKSGYELTNGLAKSCGHNYNKLKDLTGKTFGEWTVIKRAEGRYWECECSCGKRAKVQGYSLTSGASKSCGHSRRDNILNRRFGYLTAIEYLGDHKYKCRCDCGNVIEVTGGNLVAGNVMSCGCKTNELRLESLIDRYGETNTKRVNNPREPWQISVLSSKDNLRTYLDKVTHDLNRKPTLSELEDLLDVSRDIIKKNVEEWELSDYIYNGGKSDEEVRLFEYIKALCNRYGYTVEDGNRKILNGQEIDIYMPELKVGFEYNGSFWHSDNFKSPGYHLKKTLDCLNQGVRLIHIFDYELFEGKQEKRILTFIDDVINTNKTRISGRKCEITEVNNRDTKDFIEKYHIQGYVASSINLGLKYNNELIGVMTFGTPRFGTDVEYELLRMVWKPGIIVIGGAEKLFKHFITKYNPESIVSFCDISKFTGDSYEKLGFTFEVITSPNYKWVNTYRHVALSRYQTQKHKLIAEGLGKEEQTEAEIMRGLRYCRVYDCGNKRFIWKRDN